jgi:hypothetical protein
VQALQASTFKHINNLRITHNASVLLLTGLCIACLIAGFALGFGRAEHECNAHTDAAEDLRIAQARLEPTVSPLSVTSVDGSNLNSIGPGAALRVSWTWERAALVSLTATNATLTGLTFTAGGGTAFITVQSTGTVLITLVARNADDPSDASPQIERTTSLFVHCIEASVLLNTARGPVRADAINISDAFVQPDGRGVSIHRITHTRIQEGMHPRDTRLFQDASGAVKVTAMHALSLHGPRGPLVRACEHPDMEEIVLPSFPTDVFHFELADPTALLNVADTDAWLESLAPQRETSPLVVRSHSTSDEGQRT